MIAAAKRLAGPTGADRVAFAAKSRGIGPFDLIDAIRSRKVKLEDVPDAELPEAMTGLTPDERRDFVEKVIQARADLYADAIEMEKKRAERWPPTSRKRGGGGASFDSKVLEICGSRRRSSTSRTEEAYTESAGYLRGWVARSEPE